MIADTLILEFDKVLRTLFVKAHSRRPIPGEGLAEPVLSEDERKLSGALMRVNHAGEVCAQALYQGQAMTCRSPVIRSKLESAAAEEAEHLAWTALRLEQLGVRKSLLNPVWYFGAWSIGAVVGALGDQPSLGFLMETEQQVEGHLSGHLKKLPVSDIKSAAIVAQMRLDERSHAETANALGAHALPWAVSKGMYLASRVMTQVAHHV